MENTIGKDHLRRLEEWAGLRLRCLDRLLDHLPILAATIHRSISLDLDRFMELVDRDCQMIKETVPPDYRGPSMLSVVDLLAIDPIVYQPLSQMFDDAYLYPSVPRVRWNQG